VLLQVAAGAQSRRGFSGGEGDLLHSSKSLMRRKGGGKGGPNFGAVKKVCQGKRTGMKTGGFQGGKKTETFFHIVERRRRLQKGKSSGKGGPSEKMVKKPRRSGRRGKKEDMQTLSSKGGECRREVSARESHRVGRAVQGFPQKGSGILLRNCTESHNETGHL